MGDDPSSVWRVASGYRISAEDAESLYNLTPEGRDKEVTVLVLDLNEDEADKLLLTLDPLAGMAGADEGALRALLATVQTEDAAVAKLLEGISEAADHFDIDGTGMPTLADGGRAPFQQMTFTLADNQAEEIKKALGFAKSIEVETFGNENSNGNALYGIVKQWAEQKK
ncbi:MAG: hypothetical protein IIC66_09655 [candidate division Zixibacteria bacterium]|nr:hypothetical protein [candidate division Zixibacteria bacterium]